MKAEEWIAENGKKYKDRDALVEACEKATGYHHDTVVRALRKCSGKPSATAQTSGGGISEDQFRAKHDALYRLRQAVKELHNGQLYPEAEFRDRLVCVDTTKFRGKADLQEFDAYRGRANGITYWSSPATIRRLKAEGVMQ